MVVELTVRVPAFKRLAEPVLEGDSEVIETVDVVVGVGVVAKSRLPDKLGEGEAVNETLLCALLEGDRVAEFESAGEGELETLPVTVINPNSVNEAL